MRKLVTIYILVAVLLVSTYGLWQYLNTGRVSVSTNNSGLTVSLLKASEDDSNINNKPVKKSQDEMNVRVHTGAYIIQIQNQRLVLAAKTIAVKKGQTAHYDYDTPKLTLAEPVTDKSAQDMRIDSAGLTYLDRGTNIISRVDNQNNLTSIFPDKSFKSVRLLSASRGLAQDTEGSLYEIRGDSLVKLPLPAGKPLSYTLGGGGDVYLLYSSAIYKGSLDGDFKKIKSLDTRPTSIAASSTQVVLINPGVAGEEPSDPLVEIIGKGGAQKAAKKIKASSGVWSPNGKELVLVNKNGVSAVYDGFLNQKHVLPNSDITSVVWRDNTMLVYSTADAVWSYDTQTGVSLMLSSSIKGSIFDIAVDTPKRYVYISSGSDEDSGISRVSLAGKDASNSVRKLGLLLPDDIDQCHIGYINFSSPTIVLQPFSILGIEACKNTASSTLREYGLDLSKFNIVVGPIITESD